MSGRESPAPDLRLAGDSAAGVDPPPDDVSRADATAHHPDVANSRARRVPGLRHVSPRQPEPADLAAVSAQLGRPVRGVDDVSHRCGCGLPDVVTTVPKLPDGTPFPTLYYLTCPRATGAVSTLESEGLMRSMTGRLAVDAELAAEYESAHQAYLAARAQLGEVPAIAGVSAGGMPERVKCLHVLVAHSLAVGRGVNPLGDEALDVLAARGIGPESAWGGTSAGCLGGSR